MNKLHIILAIGILMAGTAAAQNVEASGDIDTMILVSTANYPDAAIAAAPSAKLGIPVLLTNKDNLSKPAEAAIERFQPEEVIIVGGPSVISENVQADVETMTNTTRLWGTTQTGTSVETSKYFWPSGSDEVVILQYPEGDSNYDLAVSMANRMSGDAPLLISKEGTLSADVLMEVERLGATEAEVYSTDAVNVTEDLNSVGVEDVELNEKEQEELSEDIENDTETGNKSKIVFVAASNYKHAISSPRNPNSATYIVSSEEEIDRAVKIASNAESGTTIKVVGKPGLARKIATRIESETDKEVDHVSGPPPKATAQGVTENRAEWAKEQRKMKEWENNVEESPEMKEAANQTLTRAERTVDENSSEKMQRLLERARENFRKGNYMKTREQSTAIVSESRVRRFRSLNRTQIKNEIRDERQDIQHQFKHLRDSNQEMAQELREAESTGERLDILRDYREENRGRIDRIRKELMETRKELEDEFGLGDDSDENKSVTESGLTAHGTESKVRIKASYTGRTGGYNMEKDIDWGEGHYIKATFDVESPNEDEAVTQAIRKYEEEANLDVHEGEWHVYAVLNVNGEQVEYLNKTVEVGDNSDSTLNHTRDLHGSEYEIVGITRDPDTDYFRVNVENTGEEELDLSENAKIMIGESGADPEPISEISSVQDSCDWSDEKPAAGETSTCITGESWPEEINDGKIEEFEIKVGGITKDTYTCDAGETAC